MAIVRICKKHGIKLLVLFLLCGGLVYIYASDPKYQGYAPDQPINFSHKIHAGELQIDCQFCHTGVEVSNHANIPDTATCMKCHEYVAGNVDKIQYLRESYKQGIPIRWVKVHDLPDHAHFSHKAHIARGFKCQQCHGPVETMAKVEVYSEFNMGWCVNCHREYGNQEAKPGNNHTVQLTECGTCHY